LSTFGKGRLLDCQKGSGQRFRYPGGVKFQYVGRVLTKCKEYLKGGKKGVRIVQYGRPLPFSCSLCGRERVKRSDPDRSEYAKRTLREGAKTDEKEEKKRAKRGEKKKKWW